MRFACFDSESPPAVRCRFIVRSWTRSGTRLPPGSLDTGDALPSVRALASELVVNPNTIAKAYAQLVRDGVLESQRGRGYFVAQRRDIYTRKERQRRLLEVLDPFLAEALTLGFDEQQIVAEIQKRLHQMTSSKS